MKLIILFKDLPHVILHQHFDYSWIAGCDAIIEITKPYYCIVMVHIYTLLYQLSLWFFGLAASNFFHALLFWDVQNEFVIYLIPLYISSLEAFIVCFEMTVDSNHSNTSKFEWNAHCSFITDNIAETQGKLLVFHIW